MKTVSPTSFKPVARVFYLYQNIFFSLIYEVANNQQQYSASFKKNKKLIFLAAQHSTLPDSSKAFQIAFESKIN